MMHFSSREACQEESSHCKQHAVCFELQKTTTCQNVVLLERVGGGNGQDPARLRAEQLETGREWVRPGWMVGEAEDKEQSFPNMWKKIVSDVCLDVA